MKPALWVIAASSALMFNPPLARAAEGKTAEEIQECVKRNAPALSSSQTVVMRAFDRAGEPTESRYRILWKRPEGQKARLMLRVLDPPTRRGSALLLVQKGERDADIFLYLADLRKTRRVAKKSLQGSMFGTDLSYEDFQRVQQMTDESTVERGEDGELDGRKVYTLVAKPHEGSAYQKAVSFVDQERCLILRAEYYESGDKPSKVLKVNPEKVTQESFGWLPREIRIDDLDEGTHTDLIIEEFDATTPVSDDDLSAASLEGAGR